MTQRRTLMHNDGRTMMKCRTPCDGTRRPPGHEVPPLHMMTNTTQLPGRAVPPHTMQVSSEKHTTTIGATASIFCKVFQCTHIFTQTLCAFVRRLNYKTAAALSSGCAHASFLPHHSRGPLEKPQRHSSTTTPLQLVSCPCPLPRQTNCPYSSCLSLSPLSCRP